MLWLCSEGSRSYLGKPHQPPVSDELSPQKFNLEVWRHQWYYVIRKHL